mgnify:FL=1
MQNASVIKICVNKLTVSSSYSVKYESLSFKFVNLIPYTNPQKHLSLWPNRSYKQRLLQTASDLYIYKPAKKYRNVSFGNTLRKTEFTNNFIIILNHDISFILSIHWRKA